MSTGQPYSGDDGPLEEHIDPIIPPYHRKWAFGRPRLRDAEGEQSLGDPRWVAEFTVVEVGYDVLVCSDDGDGDLKVIVAKPWQFRRSAFDSTKRIALGLDGPINGFTYASTDIDERTATDESDDVVAEKVRPAYYVGEKILCARRLERDDLVDLEVGNGELANVVEGKYRADWIDLNTTGRRWPPKEISAHYYSSDGAWSVPSAYPGGTVMPLENEVHNRGGGFVRETNGAGHRLRVQSNLDGHILVITASVKLAVAALASPPAIQAHLEYSDSVVTVKAVSSEQGVNETVLTPDTTALTTDSTDPGGGHAHTHTIPAHTHVIADHTHARNDVGASSAGNGGAHTFSMVVRARDQGKISLSVQNNNFNDTAIFLDGPGGQVNFISVIAIGPTWES